MAAAFNGSDSFVAKWMSVALAKRRASTATKKKMRTTFRNLERVTREGRWGSVDPATITAKQFKKYISVQVGRVSKRTVQNEASHLRRAIAGAGREEFARNVCTSQAMGVPSATRIGTGKAVDPDVLKAVLSKVRPDTKAIINLCHAMGLRGREAIQSAESLKEWARSLAAGQPVVIIRYGTKGGRIRSTFLCPSKAAAAAEAVAGALEVLKTQKHLVDSENLKAALSTNHARMKRAGLSGENSLHSLRRDFALTQYRYYKGELDLSEKVALQRLSNDLGHGDGRGRWVYNNYLRGSLNG